MRVFYIIPFFVSAFALACGSSDDNNGMPDTGDETDQSDVDQGGDGGTEAGYPAFVIDAPQVTSLGGPVLKTPKVQPVFFPGFDFATQMTDFSAKIGATTFWAALSEYQVGAIVSSTPITLTNAQIQPGDIGTITDMYIQSWLKARWDGSHSEFGTAPDPNTIYTLFYPSSTVIYLTGGPSTDGGAPADGGTLGGSKSCTSFGGYHGNVVINSMQIAYAVLPECPTFNTLKGIDAVTAATSHELSEAATDPYTNSDPAFIQTDVNHEGWEFFFGGGEIGDMCAQFPTSYYVPAMFGYIAQRNWSNANAKAGHDPCQPADGTAYFNTEAVLPDMIAARGGTMTEGLMVPIGVPKVLELDLFSDAPTSPWKVGAEAYGRNGATVPVTFSLDNPTGANGDKLHLTVTATGAISTSTTTKNATLVITSTLGGRENLWIALLGQ